MAEQNSSTLVLNGWYTSIKKANRLFDQLSEEDFSKEVAPNRSRGIYLLGHLTVINDLLFSLLDFRKPMYPELKEYFLGTPDTLENQNFTAKQLLEAWNTINNELETYFNRLTPEEWLQKHNAVSEEDFAKEPHRNKLNVLLSRTSHLHYHLGQLAFLKKK